ncbi:MAG: family 78 glycoside hydrolase catalytic domain [Pirellulales bacterium]|nr:family 78 glycoside hydrolase catalytic domain [Pirellulales bacterium]
MRRASLACFFTAFSLLGALVDHRLLGNEPAGGIAKSVIDHLLPRPRQLDPIAEEFILSAETTITVAGPDRERSRFIGRRLAQMIEDEFGLRTKVAAQQAGGGWRFHISSIADVLRDADNLPAAANAENAENYRLRVDARSASATAASARGLLWAAMTFRQLLAKRGENVAAAGVRIEDRPRYPWRGFMIDSGRAPNSLAQMKRIARICSAFKLNFVVFREGDDELAAVRYKTNKLGRENPLALGIDELKEFVAYCEQLGICVVPEIESLGHSAAKGFAYPGLAVGGRKTHYPGIGYHVRKASLNPDDPRTLTLLESIYGEWIPLLNSPFVHLGLDEVRLSKDIQAQHMERLLPLVERVARQAGRKVTPLVWADAPPTPEAYRNSVVRVPWSYEGQEEIGFGNKHLNNQHIQDLCAENCPEKVIMAGGSNSKHTPYSKSEYEGAFRNLAEWARFGDARKNFIGLLVVQWSSNMLDLWVPDFLAGADVGWNPPREMPAFAPQMDRVHANLARLADASRPAPGEVDRPAWDGIWLKGRQWDKDILKSSQAQAPSPASVEYLRCEYRVDPLGIDILNPRLSWEMHDSRRGTMQTAYRILVASTPEKLTAEEGDLWDSGKVSTNDSAQIEYAGKLLASRTRCRWKVKIWDREGKESAWSKAALWTMGLLNPGEWKAKWIGRDKEPAKPEGKAIPIQGCSLLRKEFEIGRPIRRATLYASALGIYRMHLNGKPVGDDYFMPDWTDYNKRVYYNTYDVTELVKNGPNALAGILGPGWYSGAVGWWIEGKLYGKHPRLFAQLEIELENGERLLVATDDSWKGADGPYLEGELQAGETYDAAREIPGWDRPGLDETAWRPVAVAEKIAARLEAFPGVPVRQTGELKPAKITKPKPGIYVFDMGQNFTGVERLKVRGPKGTHVVMRFAERLNPDGSIYTANLRRARCIDTYILKGEGEEVYQPRFTFHGYQYVEIANFPGKPDENSLTGIALNSDIPLVGSFECSNPLVNKLYANIVLTQRANFLSVPTDCPQRDERLGWMGDAAAFMRTGTYNADVAAFFTKWLVDVDDAQGKEGDYPHFAPRAIDPAGAAAAWADAGTICPMTMYKVYNDKRLLEKNYPGMVKWIEYCRGHSKDLLRPAEGFGDWLSIDAKTPQDVFATAYFAHSAKLTADAARILGKAEDAKKYDELCEHIKAAFNKAYVTPDARIKGETQTCYVLALAFDLLPVELREQALTHLLDGIRSRDTHLSTGFPGTALLMPTLSRFGQTPLAYKLLLTETFPSWLFPVKHGATSIWERWDGWTPERGFQDPGMNSFAHYAFGSVGQWMFQTVAGIDLAEPGYRKIVIRPELGEGLDWVKAGYRSQQGTIRSAWRKEGGKMSLDVTIPANAAAKVYLPRCKDVSPETVIESGKPLAGVSEITVKKGDSGIVLELGAGEYRFVMPWKD